MPVKKEHDNDNNKTITYKIKFADTCTFMPSKLANLVDNLSEINNKDCKICIERKKIKSECEFIGLKNNRLNCRCKECNGTSTWSINDLIEIQKQDFYNELTSEDITDKDYNHAQKVFNEYCTDMGDHHDLYV